MRLSNLKVGDRFQVHSEAGSDILTVVAEHKGCLWVVGVKAREGTEYFVTYGGGVDPVVYPAVMYYGDLAIGDRVGSLTVHCQDQLYTILAGDFGLLYATLKSKEVPC